MPYAEAYGKLNEIEVDGINAVPKYYSINGFRTPIGVISPNWVDGGATCGKDRCVRLRSGANGNITYCNNVPELQGDILEKMSLQELGDCMARLIYEKNKRIELNNFPNIHPFAYKTLRFGEIERN